MLQVTVQKAVLIDIMLLHAEITKPYLYIQV